MIAVQAFLLSYLSCLTDRQARARARRNLIKLRRRESANISLSLEIFLQESIEVGTLLNSFRVLNWLLAGSSEDKKLSERILCHMLLLLGKKRPTPVLLLLCCCCCKNNTIYWYRHNANIAVQKMAVGFQQSLLKGKNVAMTALQQQYNPKPQFGERKKTYKKDRATFFGFNYQLHVLQHGILAPTDIYTQYYFTC